MSVIPSFCLLGDDSLVETAFTVGFTPDFTLERVWREVEFKGRVAFELLFFLLGGMGVSWSSVANKADDCLACTNLECARDPVITEGLGKFLVICTLLLLFPSVSPCFHCDLLDFLLPNTTVVYILQFYCRYCGLYPTIVTTGVGVLK